MGEGNEYLPMEEVAKLNRRMELLEKKNEDLDKRLNKFELFYELHKDNNNLLQTVVSQNNEIKGYLYKDEKTGKSGLVKDFENHVKEDEKLHEKTNLELNGIKKYSRAAIWVFSITLPLIGFIFWAYLNTISEKVSAKPEKYIHQPFENRFTHEDSVYSRLVK